MTPANAQSLHRITRRMTTRDLTMIRPMADGGITTTPPEYPTQTISPTYRPRAGWTETELALQRIDHHDRARQHATWAARQQGYLAGVVTVLLTWVVLTALMYR